MNVSSYLKLGRFDRPIGITLLVIPCWWGIAFMQGVAIEPWLMVLFLLGAFVMRAAGCVLNDMLDCRFDRYVERTKERPIASGQVSLKQAAYYFTVLCFLGGLVLIQLPWQCWLLGGAAFILLTVYPLMKRFMRWPQLVLGLAFNSGIFIGAAAHAPLSQLPWLPLFLLYGAGIFITIAYDTIYACQDRLDDQRLGLNSTALTFGGSLKKAIITCYALSSFLIAMVLFLTGTTYVSLGIIALAHGFFIVKVKKLDLENRADCQHFFVKNQWLLFLIFLAILLS